MVLIRCFPFQSRNVGTTATNANVSRNAGIMVVLSCQSADVDIQRNAASHVSMRYLVGGLLYRLTWGSTSPRQSSHFHSRWIYPAILVQ
jgi:hypothetical protein